MLQIQLVSRWRLAALCLACTSGCALSVADKTACERDRDCIDGYVCIERACKATATLDHGEPMREGAGSHDDAGGPGESMRGDGGMPSKPVVPASDPPGEFAPNKDAGMDAGSTDAGMDAGAMLDAGPERGPVMRDASPADASGAEAATEDDGEAGMQPDPCSDAHGGCDPLVECTADGAVAVCGACPAGYADPLYGTVCVDLDECGTSADTCDPDPRACVNEPGGFRCACPAGFTGDGVGSEGCSRKVVELSAGSAHSCARFENGSVKCWGANDRGQLGLGDALARGDEPGEMGDALPAVALGSDRRAIQIEVGRKHSCALLDNGQVKCWGHNSSGQLGQGTSCLTDCGTGADVFDLRGDEPNEMGDALPAIQLGSQRTVLAIAAGDDHTCALLDDQSVKCWGRNDYGQLGLGTKCLRDCDTAPVLDFRGDQPGEMGDMLPPVELGALRKAIAISAGGNHSCALLDDGSIKCWGSNESGALGLGDTNDRGDQPGEMGDALLPVQLGVGLATMTYCAGGLHNCGVREDSALKCWGSNSYGELGLGDQNPRGESSGQMGTALTIVDLGDARHASALSCGGAHSCAILDDDTLKCWGLNDSGQLGQGDMLNRGTMPGDMGDALQPIALGASSRVRAVGAGGFHTCVVLLDGSVRCFGSNFQGQLGLGDSASRGDEPLELGGNLPFVKLGK